MSERTKQARREAMAIVTSVEDTRLARDMWEGRTCTEWEIVRELAGAAAGAILVVAELQGRPEADVLADIGLEWPER
jgi:hypothetical protein